jgi:hypothetical protein
MIMLQDLKKLRMYAGYVMDGKWPHLNGYQVINIYKFRLKRSLC